MSTDWLTTLNSLAYYQDEGNVVLGYVGSDITDTCTYDISKLGGDPVWIDGEHPHSDLILCERCGERMSFVLQVFAPIVGYKHATNRMLYWFHCETCESWNVIRGQIQKEEEKTIETTSTEFVGAWTDTANNWNSGSFEFDESEIENMINQRDEAVHEGSQSHDAHGEPGTGRYIETATEPEHIKQHVDDMSETEAREWASEAYERDDEHKMLIKFQRRIRRSPGQILRYSLGGTALWISENQPKGDIPPKCPHCGFECVFEMQLLSTLKNWGVGEDRTPLEWAVVALYSCSKSCIVSDVYCIEPNTMIQNE